MERQILAIVTETGSAHQMFHAFHDIFKPSLKLGWVHMASLLSGLGSDVTSVATGPR